MFDHLNVNFRILIVILMAQKRRRRKIRRLSSQCDKVFGKEATTSGWNLMHTLNFHTCDKAHSIWILMVIKRAINKDVNILNLLIFKIASVIKKFYRKPLNDSILLSSLFTTWRKAITINPSRECNETLLWQ